MSSISFEASTLDPIAEAINVTLGDIKNQPKRYDTAAFEAVEHDTILITPQAKALKRDIERRKALKTLLECVDLSNTIADMKMELTSIFEVTEADFAEKKVDFGEPITLDNLLPFVYRVMENVDDQRASRILKIHANECEFLYNTQADPCKELEQFLDTRINAFLVKRLIASLREAIEEGAITEESCYTITEHLLTNSTSPIGTNALYIKILKDHIVSILEEQIRGIQRDREKLTIVYFTIGCGDGCSDVMVCEELCKRIQGLKLKVIGLDPFVTDVSHNPIFAKLDGKIITRALLPEETFEDIIEEELGYTDFPAIVTDRYSLHHTGCSIAAVRQKLNGISLVSVEEPITREQRMHIYYRLAKIGWDLLANYAFEQRFGGGWINASLEDPNSFRVLYRRLEDLEDEECRGDISMRKVGANPLRQNCVIVYRR
ncbi:MAG TPA: hypothetical protein VFV38_33570 [Ktedonobacteraceae bacterium]|nr:hypothetical protein [Ktedonobacteraceae bacterium]